MFPKIEMVKKVIGHLYDHEIVSAYKYEKVTDEETGIVETKRQTLPIEGTPCRLDVSSSDRQEATYAGAKPGSIVQKITLFLTPEIIIAEGSTIEIRDGSGAVRTYTASSVPTYYAHHQEISLSLMEKRP